MTVRILVACVTGLAAVGCSPEPTYEQKAAKLEQQINARCDLKWTKTEQAAGECRLREYQLRAPTALK